MERKGIELLFDVSEETLQMSINSDQRRIEQVLLNLVANAMKFTFRGFVKVAIAVVDDALRFEVRDSGVGIKQESIPNLFKLFGKLQESQEINKTGCGIGLHVCQELVTRLGGVILVESKENEGSVFSFTLPTDVIDGEELESPEEAPSQGIKSYIQSQVLQASARR